MEWASWLFEQAKTASPFVSVFCLSMLIWRERQAAKRERAWESIGRAQVKASLATAKAIAGLTAKIRAANGGARR